MITSRNKFICLTSQSGKKITINIKKIQNFTSIGESTMIRYNNASYDIVNESYEEINDVIFKKK
jgi:uncharacterized protein YlzI (FlbEa/FlbD family)